MSLKYNETNVPLQCMQTQSTCYKNTRKMNVLGVLWHSTGANNPAIKRYVQPSDNAPDRAKMLEVIGVNKHGNDLNHKYAKSGLNAFIGKLANGTVATVQTMPWNFRPWGCGEGRNGSCNSGWIQFEICEDALNDREYFERVYQEACELTAYLCKVYNLDPNGVVSFSGVQVPTILCHNDSYKFGLGSGHSDVLHWFPKFGKDMDDVRRDVATIMGNSTPTETEDEDMDAKRFEELWLEMREMLQDNDSGEWSAEARQWAVGNGLIAGNGATINGEPNCMWADLLTREQLVTVLYRFAQMIGKA